MTDTTSTQPGVSTVGSRLTELAELVASTDPLVEQELAGYFVPAFVDRHPDGIAALLDSWRAAGPFTVVSTTPVAHKGWATLTDGAGRRYSLALTADTSGQVRRLIFEPEVLDRLPQTYADVDRLLERPEVESTAFVARRGPAGWESRYDRAADRAMPAGSVFKVYVLLALAQALEAGSTTWDAELELQPPQRSLPTGEMQDLPDGSRVSVHQVAHNMYARSDNTAADLLITHLGREAVLDAVRASGHTQPELLDPFPTSRELFEVGWGRSDALGAWTAGDALRRTALLDQLPDALTATVADLTEPVYGAGLDWFMSARDVAEALHQLWDLAQREESGRLREIVTTYPGVQIDRDQWPVAVFKGGSTPGVVMFCWLLEDAAGAQHVVVLQQCAERVGILRDGLPLRRLGDVIIHGLLT